MRNFMVIILLIMILASCHLFEQNGPTEEPTTTPLELIPVTITNVRPQSDKWSPREKHELVVFNDRMWVLGGGYPGGNEVWYSEDGSHWVLALENAPWEPRVEHESFVFDNKLWVAGGGYDYEDNATDYKDVWYSPDGVQWYEATGNAAWGPRRNLSVSIFLDKIWLMCGTYWSDGYIYPNDIWSSADGITWVQEVSYADWWASYAIKCLTYNDELWVFHDYAGVWNSADGIIWTQVSASPAWAPRYAAYTVFDNKMWVAGGREGWPECTFFNDVWYSENGVDWTLATSNAGWSPRYLNDRLLVSFNNKLWVTGGSYNEGYDFEAGQWAIWNNYNDVWSSPDGITWTESEGDLSSRCHHQTLKFNNRMWILGGRFTNDVWSSADGITWDLASKNASWDPRAEHSALVYDNKMWVIGGALDWEAPERVYVNDVWSSTDGITWILSTDNAAWSPRESMCAMVFDNKMWIMGGYDNGTTYNDVWSSTDGVNWVCENEHAEWPERGWAFSWAFDNKMWIAGGRPESDVWSSEDGVTWTEATSSAPWHGRSGASVFAYDNKVFLMNGDYYDSYTNTWTFYNDIWYSPDGADWLCIRPHADWQLRTGSEGVVFNNKMWIFGGAYSADSIDWEFFNDVWTIE